MTVHKDNHIFFSILKIAVTVILLLLCLSVILFILSLIATGSSFGGHSAAASTASYNFLDKFDSYITNTSSTALDGIISVEKVYLLSDSDQVAPEPNQDNFGISDNPASMEWLIDEAQSRLDGDELLFTAETPILKRSNVHYYVDDSIVSITWKQVLNNIVYTFSEVKIQHPSQFRRFLADGTFGSERQYLARQMAASVNAVVASSADFYKFRQLGVVVYNGQVERFIDTQLDDCYIDTHGDLIFQKAGNLKSKAEVEQFVADHDIRFSLSFGPILIEDGKSAVPGTYPIGEISGNYARAALCQLGPLHYVVVAANVEENYNLFPTLFNFADTLIDIGIEKAYTLDGGQTATIVMNDQVINEVSYGSQRFISDIIYFATAIPES